MHDPDMGDWSYTYDSAGNLIQQMDAKGQYIYFQYDALNRPVQKDYGTQKALGSGDVIYTYDGGTHGKGRLTHVADASGSTTFYYDIKGQLIQSDKVINSVTYITENTYDGLGRTKSTTYPDNSVITNTYNGPQLASVVEGSTTHISYSGYNAQGQPATTVYSNGVVTTYNYDPQNFRLKTLKTVNGINTTLMDLDYTFDSAGVITAIVDPIRGNQTFGYDGLNRLTSNTGPYGPVSYAYDQIGNMTNNTRVGTTYTYNGSGPNSIRPHAVTSAGGNTYSYDANGNMTGGAGRVLTYDFENRPTQITKASVTTDLVYDGDGGRVMKTVGSVTTIYVGKLYVCEASVCSRMIFANGQRVAEVESLSGASRYYHTDHLGSTGVVTDSLGNNIQDITYYPFGQAYINTGSTDARYKFTGQELDNSTDLYFYEARYYDAWLGRFISADTIVPNPFDPQALNRYSYVSNNPVIYNDPSGHCFGLCIFAGAIIGAVTAGIQSDWDLGQTVLGGLIGGISGGVGGGVGGLVSTAVKSSIIGGAVGGALAGLTSAALYRAAGYKVDIGKSAFSGAVFGAFAGAVEAHFGKAPSVSKVIVSALTSGAAGELTGGDFTQDFLTGLTISAVTLVAIEMRKAMIKQSRLNNYYELNLEEVGSIGNDTGISVGFNGDGVKLGGARLMETLKGTIEAIGSLLGGTQGGQGTFLGSNYAPGSPLDYLVEFFSGPHDWLNSWLSYNPSTGNYVQRGVFGTMFLNAVNYINVPIAAPIVAISVVGTSGLSYGSIVTPRD